MGTVYIDSKIASMSIKYEPFRRTIHSKEHMMLRELLKEHRKKLRLTQRELGEKICVHHTLIGKVETGDRRLDVIEFIDYCKGLEIDPCDILKNLRCKT